jgi:CRP-like cAMP-binding protein
MDRALLAQAPIFQDLDDDEIQAVAEICGVLELPWGEYVFREGDEGDCLYVIERGEVRISRNVPGTGEEALTVLKAGACFGEMAALDRSARSTDAIVHSGCTLLTISRADLERLLDTEKDLANKLLRSVVRLLCARLRATNDHLQSVLVMAMF